jgi:hypothetical protein
MRAKIDLVLAHVTVNPEKAGGDDGETGSALKFVGDVLVDKLVGLFSSSDAFASLAGALYGDGHDLIARDVSEIVMTLRMEGVKASLSGPVSEVEALEFTACRLNSVVLTPKHGRAVGVTLKLYVHPGEGQWDEIVAQLRKTVTLKLSGGKQVEEKPKQQASLPLPVTDESEQAEAAPVH